MFTPQRKAWSSLTITPRTEGPTSAVAKPRTAGKGKAVAFVDDPPPPPPPRAFLSETETEVGVADLDTEVVEDWRRCREAGFLDEAATDQTFAADYLRSRWCSDI